MKKQAHIYEVKDNILHRLGCSFNDINDSAFRKIETQPTN